MKNWKSKINSFQTGTNIKTPATFWRTCTVAEQRLCGQKRSESETQSWAAKAQLKLTIRL